MNWSWVPPLSVAPVGTGDFEVDLIDALCLLARTTFPEIGDNWKVSQFNKVNWANLIEQAQITLPYILFQIGEAVEDEGGMDNAAWRLPVETFVVFDPATVDDAFLEARRYGGTWRDALLRYQGDAFQCAGSNPVVDHSWENPGNRVLFDSNSTAYCSWCKSDLLVGENYAR